MTIKGDAEGEEARSSPRVRPLADRHGHQGTWDLDSRLEQAAHALQIPPMDLASPSSPAASAAASRL